MNNDAFGAPLGKLDDLSSSGLNNNFTDISNNDIFKDIDSNRVQPRQMASGVMRGTQRIVNTDGSYITMGEIPDSGGEFGIAYFDRDGQLIRKSTGTTETIYDAGVEVVNISKSGYLFRRTLLIGTAPDDGRVGVWQVIDGEDVITELGG